MTHLCVASSDPFVNDVRRVDTVANLRLVDVPVSRMAFLVEGATIPGTQWQLFYWDSTSTATDDGKDVVQITGNTTGRWKSLKILESLTLALSDLVTPLTTGTGLGYWVAPYAGTLREVQAALVVTAQASGNIFTVDVRKNGTSVLSTLITIDNGETSSITAATPAVISTASFAKGDVFRWDVTQIGNGTGKGLQATLVFNQVS